VNPTSFISFARAYRERRNQKLHSQLFDRFRIIPIKIFAGGNREAKSSDPSPGNCAFNKRKGHRAPAATQAHSPLFYSRVIQVKQYQLIAEINDI
jgi:hypothetical protein